MLTVVDFFACFLFVLCCSCLTIGCLLDLKFVMGVKDCCIVVWLLHGLLQRHRLGSWGTREMAVLSWREALSASLLGMTPWWCRCFTIFCRDEGGGDDVVFQRIYEGGNLLLLHRIFWV